MIKLSKGKNHKLEIVFSNYDLTKAQMPISAVAFPKEFFPLIGQIALLSGNLQTQVDGLIKGLCKATDTDQTKIHSSFSKRLSATRKMITEIFPKSPSVKKELTRLIEEAERLSVDRNLLCHGELNIWTKNGGTIVATGKSKGKVIRREYDYDGVERVFYDYSMLTGRLSSIFIIPITGDFYFPLPSDEKSALSSFLETNLPNSRTLCMPLFQRRSYPE